MNIPIGSVREDGESSRQSILVCDATIPLRFVHGLNAGAIKRLARINVLTLEDLFNVSKEYIRDAIRNRALRKVIFAVKQAISQKAHISSKAYVDRLDRKIREKNIRLTVPQRARILAVYIFAKILIKIDSLLKLLLDLNAIERPFRQKAELGKVYTISLRLIRA